jgi:hypothetical protein
VRLDDGPPPAPPGPGSVLDEFTAEELSVIQRFVTAAAASMYDHLESLEG